MQKYRCCGKQRQAATGIGHPHVLNDAFLEVSVAPFFGLFDVENGTARCWGDGNQKMDLTTTDDSAPADIAKAAAFLVSNDAVFITGESSRSMAGSEFERATQATASCEIES